MIYAYEPETKQQFTMWAFEDKPNPTKAVCGKSASKQIVDGFFGKTDHVAIVPLEQHCAVNSEWYTTISLEQFEKQIRKEIQRKLYVEKALQSKSSPVSSAKLIM